MNWNDLNPAQWFDGGTAIVKWFDEDLTAPTVTRRISLGAPGRRLSGAARRRRDTDDDVLLFLLRRPH